MKQTLQLKLSQHLTLTPQLQQSIRLLQLSTLELNQELERFLAENPLLERDEGDDQGTGTPLRLNGTTSVTTESREPPERTDTVANGDDSRPLEADWYVESGASGARDDADEGDYPQLAAESPTLREH